MLIIQLFHANSVLQAAFISQVPSTVEQHGRHPLISAVVGIAQKFRFKTRLNIESYHDALIFDSGKPDVGIVFVTELGFGVWFRTLQILFWF